jgi:hypothetical protein
MQTKEKYEKITFEKIWQIFHETNLKFQETDRIVREC